jgi:hypothetical protein
VETVIGTTDASPLINLRCNNPDFNANISTTTSQELRSDRNITDLVRTSGSSEGSIGFELSAVEYEPFMESALGGAFSTLVDADLADVTYVATTNTFTSAGSGFPATITAGDFLRSSGFANSENNGIFKVTSASTSAIVHEDPYLPAAVDEASPPTNALFKGKSLRNGAVKKGFTIEREFNDITEFMSHVGMLVGGMTLNAASEAIIDGSFNFTGRATAVAAATVGTGGPTTATSNPIMSAVANVGSIYEGNTLVPSSSVAFKSINLTTNNNTRALTAIGNLYPIDINMGSFNAEFAIEAYFSDSSLLDKYLAGTATELSYNFTDDSGNTILIDAPQVKYSAGSLTGVTLNSDVMQSLTGTALYDATWGYALQISYLPA